MWVLHITLGASATSAAAWRQECTGCWAQLYFVHQWNVPAIREAFFQKGMEAATLQQKSSSNRILMKPEVFFTPGRCV